MAKKSKQEPEDPESKPKPVAKSHGRSLISQIFGKDKKKEKRSRTHLLPELGIKPRNF